MTYIPNRGTIDSGNSTATLLNAGVTFTGEWMDVSAYDSISIAVKTDQNDTFVSCRFSGIEVRDVDA